MSDYASEACFVSAFWRATEATGDDERAWAWKAMGMVAPSMLTSEGLRELYDNLRIRYSEGETTELPIVQRDLEKWDFDALCDLHEEAMPPSVLGDYATVIVNDARTAEFGTLCSKALDHIATGKVKDGGKVVAERMALRLMSLYSGSDSTQGFKSRDQVVDEARARALTESHGITVPWPRLEAACGPWVPGEIIGVSAYSGEGKSTFASNLFSELISRGVPCIPVPTEMGNQWLDRVVAARSGVEQWRAEKRRWRGHEDQRDRFLAAYDEMRKLEWLMVGRMDISPAEVATAVRVLRKRWDGPVVFIVDHMHRLNYGDEEADKMAGEATRMMKNLAGELGLIGVLLYQPRKPPVGGSHHGPVAGYQIRGHSSIWNELDVHISPFRAWVKTNTDYGKTPWGTVSCDYEPDSHKPKFAKPESDGAKLDDEHVYIKVDKRRVGGEGPVVCLNHDMPSGRIYELDTTPKASRDVA